MNNPTVISISSPCHQDWHTMLPEERGKYCQKCSHPVVDFTGMTDEQVIATIAQLGTKRCGRFTSEQINRPLSNSISLKQKSRWKAILAALTAFLATKELHAGINHRIPAFKFEQPDTSCAKESATQTALKTDSTVKSVVIKGRVMERYTRYFGKNAMQKTRPVKNAEISASDSPVVIQTDGKGYFTMTVLNKPQLNIIFESPDLYKSVPLKNFLARKRPLVVILDRVFWQGRF